MNDIMLFDCMKICNENDCKNINKLETVDCDLISNFPKFTTPQGIEKKKKKKKKNTKVSQKFVHKLQINILEDLKCSICMEIMLNPVVTNPCAHRFCRKCFHFWSHDKTKLRCPCCSTTQKSCPKNCHFSNKLITTLIETMPDNHECKINYMRRREEEEEWLSDLSKQIDKSLEAYNKNLVSVENKNNNNGLCNIMQQQNEYTRMLFLTHIRKYPFGAPRRKYCALANLSETSIKQATPEQLEYALCNLGFTVPIKCVLVQHNTKSCDPTQTALVIDEQEAKTMLYQYLEMHMFHTSKQIIQS